jgi:hypothetical protein
MGLKVDEFANGINGLILKIQKLILIGKNMVDIMIGKINIKKQTQLIQIHWVIGVIGAVGDLEIGVGVLSEIILWQDLFIVLYIFYLLNQ